MTRNSREDALRALKKSFNEEGVRPALAFLNSLTNQRFTSLYRFDDEWLRNITFYDRERPEVESCEDIPVMASYCVFVRDSGAKFTTTDSLCDERVKDHPKQKSVQSYCGVPLLDSEGKMFGTVCHFDFKPGRISEEDVELLECLADLMQKKL